MGDDTDALMEDLEELADNPDEYFNRISKAKVGGAPGTILGFVGLGLLFVTFGASLGLDIAGKSFVTFGASLGLVVAGKSSKTRNIKYQYII